MAKMNHESRNRRSRLDYNRREFGFEIDARREKITVPRSISIEPQIYPPKRRFLDDGTALMHTIENAELDGYWRKLGDQYQFRSDNGGILNWWPRTGTVNFQGDRSDAWEIYDAINHIARKRVHGRKRNKRKSARRRESILILRIPELI